MQFDTPCGLLNQPANAFVAQLLDSDDRIRQLSLLRVESVMTALPPGGPPAGQPSAAAGSDLRHALSAMLQPGVSAVTVSDGQRPLGQVTFDALRRVGCQEPPDAVPAQ